MRSKVLIVITIAMFLLSAVFFIKFAIEGSRHTLTAFVTMSAWFLNLLLIGTLKD